MEATIKIKATSELQAATVQKHLQIIAENITPENLAVLAQKATKPGINLKIQQFKSFI